LQNFFYKGNGRNFDLYIFYREETKMAKVGILMGSDSDLPIMSKAAKLLEEFGI